jgi:hypothetical protein
VTALHKTLIYNFGLHRWYYSNSSGICGKSCFGHIIFFGGRGMATHFDEYEKQARQLEQISKALSKKSAKYAALKRATWALAFVTMHHHSEFQKFLRDQQNRELSPCEHEHLSELGLE